MLLTKTVAQAEQAWFPLFSIEKRESEAEQRGKELAGRDDSVFLWQHIRAFRVRWASIDFFYIL